MTQYTTESHPAQRAKAKQVDEELSASEARFQAIFDSAAVGIGIMGLDRKVITANPALCRMYGRSLAELVGQTSALVVHPEEQAEALKAIEALTSGRIDHYTADRRYVRKNGQIFWAHITLSLVRNLTGTPNYL